MTAVGTFAFQAAGMLTLHLLFFSTPMRAQSIDSATFEARRDLETATTALAKQRREQAAQRAVLNQELLELQSDLATRREIWSTLKASIQTRAGDERELRTEIDQLQETLDQLHDLQLEYRRGFSSRIQPAEAAQLAAELSQLDALTNLTAALPATLDFAQTQFHNRVRSQSFPGSVILPDGTLTQGRILQLGPLGFFAGTNTSATGQIFSDADPFVPTLLSVETPEQAAEIRRLIDSGAGQPAIDLSGGKALRGQTKSESWQDELRAGGAVMIPLLILAGFALLVALIKVLQLYTIRLRRRNVVDRILRCLENGDHTAAETLAARQGATWRPVLEAGITHWREDPEMAGELMQERILARLPVLERLLAVLAVTAAAAPLLGLLGTVTGMIRTFDLIRLFGTGDARYLSGGISEALITTKFGLIVAIPALIAHALLSRRVRRIVGMLDEHVIHFVQGLRRLQRRVDS